MTDRVVCSCCGLGHRPLVPLRSRNDVRLCRECLGWLTAQIGVTSTPTLPVADMPAAVEFYERAGFEVRVYLEEDGTPGGFAFVGFDGDSVFDLGLEDIDPAQNRAGCYLVVQDVDAWHARISGAGITVGPLADQPWGMREFTLVDPFNNRVRVGSGTTI